MEYNGGPIEGKYWDVLHHSKVTVEVTSNGLPPPHTYQFRLVVNTDDTGFQVDRLGLCEWATPTADRVKWTDWFSAPEPVAPPNELVEPGAVLQPMLARCGRGTGNVGMKVEGRDGPGGIIFTVMTTGNIPEAVHQADHKVSYNIADPFLDSPVSSLFPGYTLPGQAEFEKMANDAADIWSGRDKEHPIWQGQSAPVTFDLDDANPEVTIEGFWNNGKEVGKFCDRSVACGTLKYVPSSRHYAKGMVVRIEFPPTTGP